jgi:phospholipid-binding lipoprotein MlaA
MTAARSARRAAAETVLIAMLSLVAAVAVGPAQAALGGSALEGRAAAAGSGEWPVTLAQAIVPGDIVESGAIVDEGADPLFDEDWGIDETLGFPDPFQPVNRLFLEFNRGLDKVLFDPLTQLYRFAFPPQIRLVIRRVFLNLGSPPIVVNDLLQGEFEDAGVALGRLSINTLLGGGGMIDVAAGAGLSRHRADFGQTLALYGVASGPYLVLPIFGPGNARDMVGGVVDGLMRPATWILGFTEQIYYGGGSGLSTREESYEALQALVESSVDFYAALRNAYYQARMGELWARRDGPIVVLVPEFADERDWASEARVCRWIMRRSPRTGLRSCSRQSRGSSRNRLARTP